MRPLALLIAKVPSVSLPSSPPTPPQLSAREGNRITEGVPELPESITGRMRQYQNTQSASVRGWTSDSDGLLISTRFGETNQLHLVGKPGGARGPLTFFRRACQGCGRLFRPMREQHAMIIRRFSFLSGCVLFASCLTIPFTP